MKRVNRVGKQLGAIITITRPHRNGPVFPGKVTWENSTHCETPHRFGYLLHFFRSIQGFESWKMSCYGFIRRGVDRLRQTVAWFWSFLYFCEIRIEREKNFTPGNRWLLVASRLRAWDREILRFQIKFYSECEKFLKNNLRTAKKYTYRGLTNFTIERLMSFITMFCEWWKRKRSWCTWEKNTFYKIVRTSVGLDIFFFNCCVREHEFFCKSLNKTILRLTNETLSQNYGRGRISRNFILM